MGPLHAIRLGAFCFPVALGPDGTACLSFFSFFVSSLVCLDRFLLPSVLLLLTAASHFTALSLWDYTTQISLCHTNCCHDNSMGAVCERDVSVIVCLIANLGAMGAFVCVCVCAHVRTIRTRERLIFLSSDVLSL